MKIKISIGGGPGGNTVEPVDPPPPPDINQFFQLDAFSASKMTFAPFEEVTIQWAISGKSAGVQFEDFKFSLSSTEGVLLDDLPSAGSISLNPHKSTLVRVRGQKRGGTAPSTLGQGIALAVDESACDKPIEIPQSIVDGQVLQRFNQMTAAAAQIRLRQRVVALPPAVPTPVVVEEQPVATWTTEKIRYDFPLEIDINNFFNADFDLTLEIRINVDHDASGSELEVKVAQKSDVDFSTAEDILSLGSASSVASGIEKLMPLVFDCQTRALERSILQALLGHPGVSASLAAGKRLLAVRIVPLDTLTHLSIVFCPMA